MVVNLGEQLTLEGLLANLNHSFRIVADLDTLTHELYAIQQGSHESVNWYATRLKFTLLNVTYENYQGQKPPKSTWKTLVLF